MLDNFVIGDYIVTWFQIIIVITVILLSLFSIWINKHDNNILLSKYSFVIIPSYVIICTLIGFVGARLLAFMEIAIVNNNNYHTNNWTYNTLVQNVYGESWYGGFILVAIIVVIFSGIKLSKEKRIYFLNYNGILVTLAYILGRQACFISADGCYGIPTNHPFGMRFLHGIKPTLLTVHPTPLYESITHVIIFILLFRIRKMRNYIPVALFLILSGSSRFFIEFIRTNPRILFNLSMAQIISVLMFIMGAIILFNQLNLKFVYHEK